jgi:hypothetical protein
MMAPLEIVGQITVPDSVMQHRFAIEALGAAMVMAKNVEDGDSMEQVVGTANTRQVELYGWAPNVDSHQDHTGYVYLVALNEGRSTLNVWNPENKEDAISVWLPRGAVVRLDDFHAHWTEDDRPRVCAFIGSYSMPQDHHAVAQLQAALMALEHGQYYGAPRVRDGFRALLEDECIAHSDFEHPKTMLLKDAEEQGLIIEYCGQCMQPAVRLDNHWPYETGYSFCREHLGK